MASEPESPQADGVAPRRGCVAWIVFVVAIGAMLALAGGCMAAVYWPLVERIL